MRGPDFFIIGQARSGTNSLQFQLDQHPEIFTSNETKKIFGIEPEVKLEKDYLAQFMNIKHIEEDLETTFQALPWLVLDGELYNHNLRGNFEKII